MSLFAISFANCDGNRGSKWRWLYRVSGASYFVLSTVQQDILQGMQHQEACTVDCLITNLSGCHKRHLCQDLEVRRYYKFLLSQCSKWVVIPRLSQSRIKVSMAWEWSYVWSWLYCFLETVWFSLACVLIPTPICSNILRQASQLRIFDRNFSQELCLCGISKLAGRGCESSTEQNQHNCGSANRERQKPVLSVPPFRDRRDCCGNLPYTKSHPWPGWRALC